MPRFATILVATLALATAASTHAQSDPANFDTVINVPGDPVPSIIGSNTQLNITDGGAVSVIQPGRFSTPTTPNTIEVNVLGGTVQGLAAYYTTVNISGGNVGVAYAYWGGVYNISGGRISGGGSQQRSTFNISGGVIDGTFATCPETEVNFSGGTLLAPDSIIRISDDSTFRMTGGILGQHFSNYTGGTFELSGGAVGADIDTRGTIYGGEFELNGVPYTDDSISIDSINNPNDIFTGVLADGSPFIFAPSTRDRLREVQLSRVEPPAIDLNPILVDTANPTGPYGLRPGQSLTLESGGSLGGNFAAIDSNITINGGEVGHGMELLRSSVVMNGGTIGAGPLVGDHLHVFSGSGLTVNDGVIATEVMIHPGAEFQLHRGEISAVNIHSANPTVISGGRISGQLVIGGASAVSISNGFIEQFANYEGGTVEISGGTFGVDFRASSGTTLVGGEFKVNGATYVGSTLSLDTGDVFTAALADGSTFVAEQQPYRSLTGIQLATVTLPAIEATSFLVDSPSAVAPRGLRAGQTLTLREGGTLGDNFAAVGATVTIEGGQAGRLMEISESHLTVTEGALTSPRVFQNSRVVISGGEFDFDVHPQYSYIYAAFRASESDVNIQGGTFNANVQLAGGVAQLRDAVIKGELELTDGAVVHLSGGQWHRLRAQQNSHVNILGTSFSIDGMPVEGLELNQALEISGYPQTISGVFPDGTAFNYALGNRGKLWLDPGVLLTITPLLPGDFNGDAVVDLADYTVWRDNLGSDNTLPGDLTPGTVTQDDYDLWKSHFGEVFQTTAPTSPAQVPEPTAAILLAGFTCCSFAAGYGSGRLRSLSVPTATRTKY